MVMCCFCTVLLSNSLLYDIILGVDSSWFAYSEINQTTMATVINIIDGAYGS